MSELAPSSVDLHCHSTASDGLLSPSELVAYGADRGLAVIGLTDHDSVNGIQSARSTGDQLGIEVIPGVELSSEIDGLQAHILGYFIDADSPSIHQEFAWMVDSRRERISRICQNLNDAGVPIDVEEVYRLAGSGTIGRPHVARVLVSTGYASDVSDAFGRYLTRGKPGYALSEKITPEGAILAIHRAGGVAVLAHPWSTRNPRGAVRQLVSYGLDGLECFYGEYEPSVREDLAALAAEYRLIPTGGSDFHGKGVKSTDLGGVFVPPESVEALRNAADALESDR